MPEPQLVGDIIGTDLPELSQPRPTFEETKAAVEAAAKAAAEAEAQAREQFTRLREQYGPPTPAPEVIRREGAEPPPIALDNLSYLLNRRAELTVKINELTARREDIDQAVKEEMGQHEIGTLRGRQVARWTTVVTHRLDQGAVKQQHPDVYAACLKAHTSRRFTLDTAALLGGEPE